MGRGGESTAHPEGDHGRAHGWRAPDLSLSTGAFARISPWIAVGVALVYFLYEQLELGGARPQIAALVALTAAGALFHWRDTTAVPDPAASDVARRALVAAALLLPASLA